jgi:hypothetical protein
MPFFWWDRCGDLAVDLDGRLWRWDGESWRRLGPIDREPDVPVSQLPCLAELASAWAAADDRDELVAEAKTIFFRGLTRRP